MTGRHWISLTIGTIIAVSMASAALAYALDPYGILRDPTGRKLAIYDSVTYRKAKVLMSKWYVPANFNGLLVGDSAGLLWSLPRLADARVFNETLGGANAVEEQYLVNQALPKGHFKLLICLIHATMTSTHRIADGMDQTSVTEALGSVHLFANEIRYILRAANFHFFKASTAPDGQILYSFPGQIQVVHNDESFYRIDPIALTAYRNLILSLRNTGAAVVYVVPPMFEANFQDNKKGSEAYTKDILSLLPPAPLINFDGPQYTAFRSDPENFWDANHLSIHGAAAICGLLGQLVPKEIASGR